MGEIRVAPEELRHSGSQARQIGGHVLALAGDAHGVRGGSGSSPAETGAALHAFHASWSSGVARMGDTLSGLGMTTEVAAGLYEQTDAGVVPDS